jgi:hypothetical protein
MLRGQCSGNLVWKALIFWFDLDLIPSFSFLMLTNNRIVVLVYSVQYQSSFLLSFFFCNSGQICLWLGGQVQVRACALRDRWVGRLPSQSAWPRQIFLLPFAPLRRAAVEPPRPAAGCRRL